MKTKAASATRARSTPSTSRHPVAPLSPSSSPSAPPAPTSSLVSAPAPTPAQSFPIVGVGASAGGVEALTLFFGQVPDGCGMAFVVIQHLDPTQKDMMPELLQRITPLKVFAAKDRSRIKPNRIYVIPPDNDLSILHGVLHLLAPVTPRGLRLPIDFFFRALADDRREHGIGVLLSGMGTDGTEGLRAIRAKGGLTLTQDPAEAKYDSMPRSAINAQLIDLVAPADQLPGKLIDYLRNRRNLRLDAAGDSATNPGHALEKIVILLRSHTGNDFSLYRRSTLERRVEHRMGIHRFERIDAYVRYLRENPHEVGILFKELLIGVTGFFRDPTIWATLARLGLTDLLKRHPPSAPVRAWIAGCSTGEEAYTLAILLTEVLNAARAPDTTTLQIYATDLDQEAIEYARQGFYPSSISESVSPERLSRFFIKEAKGYQVRKELRSRIIFAPHNLIMDPPFTKLDILCCRNLLIYLTPELQRKIIPLFHYCLNPRALLLLGSSESIGTHGHLFSSLAAKERIFQRHETSPPSLTVNFPAVFSSLPVARLAETASTLTRAIPAPQSLQAHAETLLLSRFTPPAVIVNAEGDILYINGHTGAYLEPAAGKANWNVVAMAREGLRYELASALTAARRQSGPVLVRGLVSPPPAPALPFDLLVEELAEPRTLVGLLLVAFLPATFAASAKVGPRPRPRTLAPRPALEHALRLARDEAQAARAESRITQEELKSMNEELQSTNEELQSTNEELTTSKEEMQTLNEELHTLNSQLQTKLNELSATHNDISNLLNSTDIATVFLDRELRVRRFTLHAQAIIKFIPTDVGRPVTDLASDLLYPELVEDALAVVRTLTPTERAITTRDGRWFNIRLMPYRTVDERVEGVVITFADTTVAKNLEAELRARSAPPRPTRRRAKTTS